MNETPLVCWARFRSDVGEFLRVRVYDSWGEEVRGMAGKYRGPRIKVCFGGKVYLNVGRLAEDVGEDPDWFRKGREEGRKGEGRRERV
jgi:hypothetical protein